jgi:hypothetical protein
MSFLIIDALITIRPTRPGFCRGFTGMSGGGEIVNYIIHYVYYTIHIGGGSG